jgi:serine/threonine protein kinase
MNFVHCDLKLQNVLLTDKKFEKVKVADFGLSKALN